MACCLVSLSHLLPSRKHQSAYSCTPMPAALALAVKSPSRLGCTAFCIQLSAGFLALGFGLGATFGGVALLTMLHLVIGSAGPAMTFRIDLHCNHATIARSARRVGTEAKISHASHGRTG